MAKEGDIRIRVTPRLDGRFDWLCERYSDGITRKGYIEGWHMATNASGFGRGVADTAEAAHEDGWRIYGDGAVAARKQEEERQRIKRDTTYTYEADREAA